MNFDGLVAALKTASLAADGYVDSNRAWGPAHEFRRLVA